MNELVFTSNDRVVTSSVNVSRDFNKRHNHVLRDIRNLQKDVSNFGQMFYETEIADSYGRPRRAYLMNRDGFTLLAMGFTGSEAMEFKLKYINKFNELENKVKQNELDMKGLSPELQIMNNMVRALANQELANKQMKKELHEVKQDVTDVRNIFTINPKSWRKEVNDLIIKISRTKRSLDAYRETRNESYQRLEDRARCDLNIRLQNMRDRMRKAGASKTAIDRKNKMDVIENDTRLMEIYLTIVKEMAIKHNVRSTKAVV